MQRHGPGRSSFDSSQRVHLLVVDLGALAALCLLALVLGLVSNHRRQSPLPLRYQPLQVRLDKAVSALSAEGLAGGGNRQIPQISLENFQKAVTSRTALILDARPDGFYRLGHVPGALNLSRESFAADYQRLRSRLAQAKDKPVIVYCSDPDCRDSQMVAAALLQLGFRQASDLPAGWEGWTAAGLPEEKGTPP